MQQDSNPEPLSSKTNTQPFGQFGQFGQMVECSFIVPIKKEHNNSETMTYKMN